MLNRIVKLDTKYEGTKIRAQYILQEFGYEIIIYSDEYAIGIIVGDKDIKNFIDELQNLLKELKIHSDKFN